MKKNRLLIALLFTISQVSFATMQMDEKGMVMNANSNNLPKDCSQISETVNLTIHAGQKYAEKFNGKMFAFDRQQWDVKPCSKINIIFINDDQIRHQFMIHGLPGYLYPDGMLHLELYGEGQLRASLIVPNQKKTYLVHCELAQHAEKGMKAQLKVGGGDGDLPSIPAISAPINSDHYLLDWTELKLGGVFALFVITITFGSGHWLLSRYFGKYK
ncbi:MAG: multicopper oxidase domain-containing protein [Methylococcales bacterium]|nr:multicopper oxidase domain-containing protein [Methylococcales bacterium]MDD5753709.1 multicopper oxidase domain-containing protein [Methylococcales bacterium]